MPIEVVSKRNLNQYSASQNSQNAGVTSGSAWVNPYAPEKVHNNVKLGVLSTTLAGVALALVAVMKFRKIPFNASELFKGNFKNCGLWNVEYKEKEILTVAAGSISGGLLGGLLFDKKENIKAKLREAVIQFIGNVAIPIGCVSGGIHLYKKYKGEIQGQAANMIRNAKAKEVVAKGPKFLITAIGLGLGIYLGNKIGNLINGKIFNINDNRKLKAADMSPHIDDVCFALTMAGEGEGFIQYISRVIPIALMISGYSTGIMQEKPQIIEHERQCHNCKNA